MAKPKVLLIKTGGTVGQKPDANGVLRPSSDEYIRKVWGLRKLAALKVVDLGNIDSTNMATKNSTHGKMLDRTDIAKVIYDNALEYDGFVIVHGTDTMAETAAALTYMLPGFRKPIVLTGSQRPIWHPRSDAYNNIYTAVEAATKDFGEVVIAFGNYILRGSRARKVDEERYDAFYTPGTAPVGELICLNEGIRLAENRIRRGAFDPRIFTDFDTRVFHYAHLSGATIDDVLMDVARSGKVSGILLGGFGAGNVPDTLLPFIRAAKRKGKPVFVYTKCDTGAADMGIYSVGIAPLEAGAKPAGDMTLEALGQKLMFALGRATHEGLTGEKRLRCVESIIETPYGGDITVTKSRR